MSYIIEIQVMGTRCNSDGSSERVPMWLKVRPTDSNVPYTFETREQAERIQRMCYPEAFHVTRIVKEVVL